MITNYAHSVPLWTRPCKYLFPLRSIHIPRSTSSSFEHTRSLFPRTFQQKEVQRKCETNNTSRDCQADTKDARCSVTERHVNVATLVAWERSNSHGIELCHEGQGKEDDGDDVQDKQSDRVATAILGDFARVVGFEDVGLFLCTPSVRKEKVHVV